MRLLSRNLLREITPPFLLGLATYSFLLLLRSLLLFSELVLRRGLGVGVVAELVVMTLPQILVLTIPMAFLFGILIAIGRLSGDSEIVAMRSCGVSRWALTRPVLATAAGLSVVVGALSTWGYPAANARLVALENKLFASAAVQMVRPRTFTSPVPGREFVLFVDRDSPGSAGWQGIFLSDRSNPALEQVVLAREGRFRSDSRGLWLDLSEATAHAVRPDAPGTVRISRNRAQSLLLHESPRPTASVVSSEPDLRAQTLPELLRTERHWRARNPARARLARVEIHKKLAIPVACLVFALVGVPLGIANRRGGRGSGFAISIGIILAYYLLLSTGETWAGDGRLAPALAMWLPDILLAILGVGLFLRRDDERRSWRERFSVWRARRAPATGPRPSPPARRAALGGIGRFPAALDRYVLGPFLLALAAIYASVTLLYLVVDYADHADDIVSRHIPGWIVGSYYRALLAPVLVQILPFCVLLAALISLGALSRSGEDTAFRACGVPLPRLGVGILAIALLSSGISFVAAEYVLPAANRRSHEMLDRIKGRAARPPSSETGGFWILGSDGRIWNFDSFDPGRSRIWRPSVYEIDSSFRLTRRISADSAVWNGAGWTFRNGWQRIYRHSEEAGFQRFSLAPLVGGDPPRLFSRETKRPDEMRYGELARYVRRLAKTGYPVAALATALSAKPAAALQPVVLALLAIPFAFSIGKRGALTGIGIGIVCGMIFLVLAAFFQKLGEVGSLPPTLAAWSPNLIFLIFGLYRTSRLRT